MFAVIACSYLYSTHSVIRHSTCFNCHSWKNEKWKNEFIYVFITSFSSVPDSSMFFVQYKETLRHLINKAFLRYNMWCYYFQTFHKEILHDRRIQDTFSSCNFSANSYFSHASYIIHFPFLMPCYSKNL